LAQFLYTPQPVDTILKYIESDTPDLKTFIERIKNEYWPEWDEVSQNLLMNAKTPEEKAAEAEAAAKKAAETEAPAKTEAEPKAES